MNVIQNPKELQALIISEKREGKRIGFVPTMGNLHEGHLSLIDTAKAEADIIIASIFVNPMQFGPNEDFDSYPRTLERDLDLLKLRGTDIVFTPTEQSIYPQGKAIHTRVEVPRLTDKLCGASRPGHFQGVTTVVNILLNIVQPDVAVFGKKDYQQLLVIKAMVSDLMLPVRVIGGEILREDNGLAMSSRNGYLSESERAKASQLRKIICEAADKLRARTAIQKAKLSACEALTKAGFKVDYFEIVRQDDLTDANDADTKILIAAAAWLGQPRLIDNLELNLDEN